MADRLDDAVQRFRAIAEATTSAMVAPTHTASGLPFFGKAGLKQVERERKARMKAQKTKCKGYDPKCRDKEWEVKAPSGGVSLLRRSPIGGR